MIITNQEQLNEAMEFIKANDLLAYDIETNSLNIHTGTVIGIGWSNASLGYYLPLYSWSNSESKLNPVLFGSSVVESVLRLLATKKLIMHNGSFDIRFTKENLKVDLVPALYCDTMLLKHTCDEEFPFGLKEIATKLWGDSVTDEKEAMQASIKDNGGTTKEYYKANVSVLGSYGIKDCLLTYKIYLYYQNKLERANLSGFFYKEEVMPLYRDVTIPMEQHGVRLDMEKLQLADAELERDLQDLEQGIQEAILPHLELFTTWFLNKEYGATTPTGKVPVWQRKYGTREAAWKAANTGPMFNLLSKHHLKKLFFDTLKEEPLSRTPTGLPQVDEEFLDSIATKYLWVQELIVYNKLTKLRGTYVQRLLNECHNGRFYPSFLQHRTVSGRYGGDMQQMPRPLEALGNHSLVVKHTNRIREFVLPDVGHKLVSADYEQLEPTIFAHVSGDNALRDIFRQGTDFYSTVAIRTEGLKGVSDDKQADNYLGKVNKAARQKAKVYALGLAYGMTGYKLKFEINVDEETAEQLVQNYLNAFPQLARWMNESKDKAVAKGEIKTQTGRVRHLQEAQRIHAKYGASILHDLQLWKQYHDNPSVYTQAKADRRIFKNALNNAINFQIQGLAASIVNRASIAIARKLKELNSAAKLVLQVHDEVVLTVPETELATLCPVIKDIMENTLPLSVPLRTVPQVTICYSLLF